MPRGRIIVPLVLLALLAAILAPIPSMGYVWLGRAEASFDAHDFNSAAESYAQAARLLPWRDDLWESAGISASLGGNYLKALEYFEHVTTLSEQGWMFLGLSHVSLGDPDSAIAVFNQGLQFYDSSSLYQLLAFVHYGQKDFASERVALESQIRLEPNGADSYVYYRLGLLLTVLEPEQALTHLMFAASLDPKFDPAVQTLRSALNLSATQPDASQQMVTIGRALGLVKEWNLAIAAFEKAIALDGKNPEAWAWLGEAKQQFSAQSGTKGENGFIELDKAVRLDHTSVVVRGLRALYWSRQGKYFQMRAEYALAAMYEPDNPAWQAGLGDSYAKSGDLVSSLAAYRRATELAPDESAYWALLAVFCADNNVYLEEVGLPAAKKAVELSPDDSSALAALGWVYLASGRYASAEHTLLDVTDRAPDDLSAHFHLALTYLAQGNSSAAREKLIFIQNTDPEGPHGELAGQLLKEYFP
jgi:tetratricopeptide (TPR) repeat protein